uniref:hypothetical protein n=1 Tax=Enterocloster clostridioformis TaxID=1531 RepID=UPI003AB8B631
TIARTSIPEKEYAAGIGISQEAAAVGGYRKYMITLQELLTHFETSRKIGPVYDRYFPALHMAS